ncbi:Mob1/phocein [Fusarium oxysporum Fo47]|uniref:Mob1/phocein n=1 Tax=Fusarium oxysporum Fo47 TaxID=660027 RepID=UPI002869E7A4|nr:Mob1/phocein [Fusarium oxysporum Fo47]WJG34456.1 Mob1/phocein [Fusarium oxysporum Fo47]
MESPCSPPHTASMFRYLNPKSLLTMLQLETTIIPVSLSGEPLMFVDELTLADPGTLVNSNQRTRNQFRPRVGKGGSASYQLRQYAEVTLGGGSLRKVVKLPEGEDENEWLAVNMVDFYNQINLLYGAITEFCSPQSCPEMKATDEFEYLWQDNENYKRPTKMPAPAYIEQLMSWVQANIDNEQVLPSKIGVPFPKSFPALVRQIFKRMYRVYAHIYCHHYPVIRELGLEPHLNTSFKHESKPNINHHTLLLISLLLVLVKAAAVMFSRQVLRAARVAAPQRALALRAAPVRSFAAAASTEVKPPISVFGVDGTYATALYTAAVKTSSIDAAADALNRLGALIEKDPKLAAVLSAPTLTAADKKAIVQELEKQINTKDETVKNFLATLAENNRLGLIPGVVEKFSSIISAARGEVELTVTSAQALDKRTLNRLETAVSKSAYVGQGQKLKVTNEVNPEIVGGLVVEIGDRTIDLSVSSRIAKMNKLLTDSLVSFASSRGIRHHAKLALSGLPIDFGGFSSACFFSSPPSPIAVVSPG